MLAAEMYEFRNRLAEQGIVFCYSGCITESVLSGIGMALKSKLANDQEQKGRARALFAVFVEQVQNVVRYSAEREQNGTQESELELRYGVLVVGKETYKYFISCSNRILKEDVAQLEENLSTIKAMNPEDLKFLYRERLKGEPPEGSKGAGVGFIDIARRASFGFDYDFAEINDDYAYFTLRAYV